MLIAFVSLRCVQDTDFLWTHTILEIEFVSWGSPVVLTRLVRLQPCCIEYVFRLTLIDIQLSSHFRSDFCLAITKSKFASHGRYLKELTTILGTPLVDSSALSRVK